MPGIVTGDIMAFTMSVDDFVVSYFTAGTTNQPLSVVIYSMTRHRMTPKINAVSTLLFLFVLVLLVIINVSQSRDEKRREAARRGGCIMKLLKRTLALTLSAAMVLGLLSGCGSDASANVLNVYNWGEYIDTDLLDRFEQETGIKVIYNTFTSNENVYSRIQTMNYDEFIQTDNAMLSFIDEEML